MLSQSLTTDILFLTDTQLPVTLRDFGLMTSTCSTQRQRSLMRSISSQSFRRLAAMRTRLQEWKNLTVFAPHISLAQGLIEWTCLLFYSDSCLRVDCFLAKWTACQNNVAVLFSKTMLNLWLIHICSYGRGLEHPKGSKKLNCSRESKLLQCYRNNIIWKRKPGFSSIWYPALCNNTFFHSFTSLA